MPHTVVKMPQLGESVSEGTIGRWLKQPGDRVEPDEPLVEIQTDKVNAELPSPVAGIVQQLLQPEGATVAVQTDILIIGDEVPAAGQAVPAPSPASIGAPSQHTRGVTESAESEPLPQAPHPSPTFTYDNTPGGGPTSSARVTEPANGDVRIDQPDGKRFYTPVVLRMAQEHGIDLESLQGSGLSGRVTRKDVERAIATGVTRAEPPDVVQAPKEPKVEQRLTEAPAPVPGPAPLVPASPGADVAQSLTPMRRAIAQHMTRSRSEIPDAWSMVEIDATRLVRQRASLLADWQAREGFELTFLPFFVKAVLAGLRAVPELNATWEGESVKLHRRYDLGIAVSMPQGLVVPVLRRADQLSVAGIARELREIVQKARAGKLTSDDLQGATFTVNNPGSLGSIMSQPIIPVGQAGIATMEAILKRPVVVDEDAIAVRSMMNCCLSFDHRILDGAQALRFLRTLREQVETVEYPLY